MGNTIPVVTISHPSTRPRSSECIPFITRYYTPNLDTSLHSKKKNLIPRDHLLQLLHQLPRLLLLLPRRLHRLRQKLLMPLLHRRRMRLILVYRVLHDGHRLRRAAQVALAPLELGGAEVGGGDVQQVAQGVVDGGDVCDLLLERDYVCAGGDLAEVVEWGGHCLVIVFGFVWLCLGWVGRMGVCEA